MKLQKKNGRKRAPRLNIFQKVQIADYAAGLLAESRQKLVVKKRRKTHAKPSARKYFAKGLNLQALCENKFPQMRGIKICQLIYQCETSIVAITVSPSAEKILPTPLTA